MVYYIPVYVAKLVISRCRLQTETAGAGNNEQVVLVSLLPSSSGFVDMQSATILV